MTAMPKETDIHHVCDPTCDQLHGTMAQRGIGQDNSGRVNAQAKEQHLGEAKDEMGHAKEAGAEAGGALKEAAKDAFAGVKQGVIETAKEVKSKAADVADAVKTKYRKLSESLQSSDSGEAHRRRSTRGSVDLGAGGGSSVDYGANGGIQPAAALDKAYEAKPGTTYGAGSNVEYETSVKVVGAPSGTAGHTTTEKVSRTGTKPETHAERDVEHAGKDALEKGTEKMDELRRKGSDKMREMQQKSIEMKDELIQKGTEKMDDLRQKASEKLQEAKEYVGDKLHELGRKVEPGKEDQPS